MKAATGGVNTHQGAIFSLGLLCAAAGRLLAGEGPRTPAELGRPAAAMAGQGTGCAGARREAAEGYARELAALAAAGKLQPDEITEELFARHTYTGDLPDPDVIIRPSGELRLSNFLTWQSAYSELWFSDVLWPDFTRADLDQVIHDFEKRNRRFGGV